MKYFKDKMDAAQFAAEKLLLLENVSVLTTITGPERSEDYCVFTATDLSLEDIVKLLSSLGVQITLLDHIQDGSSLSVNPNGDGSLVSVDRDF